MNIIFKLNRLFAIGSLLAVPSLRAATINSWAFEPPAYDNSNVPSLGHNPVATQDGWVIDDLGQAGDPSYPSGYLSFLADWDSGLGPQSTAGALGGLFDAPINGSVNLTQSFAGGLVAGGGISSTFAADFSIQESSDPAFPGNDIFGWKFLDSNDDVFLSIDFVPSTNTPGTLEVFWSQDGSLGGSASGNWLIYYDRSYKLEVSFENPTAGNDLAFSLNILGGLVPPILPGEPDTSSDPITGVLTGAGLSEWGSFATTWTVGAPDPSDAGSNFIIFDNIALAVVPEPGAACLGALGLLAFVRRKRR